MTHWKRPQSWERLRAGGGRDDRGQDGWMASLTQWTWVSKFQEIVKDGEAWRAAVCGVSKSQTQHGDWTTTKEINHMFTKTFNAVVYMIPCNWRQPKCSLTTWWLRKLLITYTWRWCQGQIVDVERASWYVVKWDCVGCTPIHVGKRHSLYT